MNLGLSELYQDMVMDHARSPRNRGRLEGDHVRSAEGHNPMCGDRVDVFLEVEDGRITDVKFEGEGCAISTASASLMTELVKGKTVEEAQAVFDRFRGLVTGQEARGDDLEPITILAGVSRFPMRVKCATLAWHAMREALDGGGDPVATE